MQRRPWPLVILVILQFLTPLVSVGCSAYLEHASYVQEWIRFLNLGSPGSKFDFIAVPWIIGILIYRMNPIGFIFSMGMNFYNIYDNFAEWMHHRGSIPFWMFLAACALNFALVIYLCLPEVRKIFFRANLRWWESKPRFQFNAPAIVTTQSTATGQFFDIAEGGGCIDIPSGPSSGMMKKGDVVSVSFNFQQRSYKLSCTAVYELKMGQHTRVGFRWVDLPLDEKWRIEELLDVLGKQNTPCTRELPFWVEDFKKWAAEARRSRQAWFRF